MPRLHSKSKVLLILPPSVPEVVPKVPKVQARICRQEQPRVSCWHPCFLVNSPRTLSNSSQGGWETPIRLCHNPTYKIPASPNKPLLGQSPPITPASTPWLPPSSRSCNLSRFPPGTLHCSHFWAHSVPWWLEMQDHLDCWARGEAWRKKGERGQDSRFGERLGRAKA